MAGATVATASSIALLGKFTSFLGDAVKTLNEIVLYEQVTVVETSYPATKKGRRVTKTVTRPVKITLLEVLIGLVIAKLLIYDEMNDKWIWNPISGVAPAWLSGGLLGQMWSDREMWAQGFKKDVNWGEDWEALKKRWASIDWSATDPGAIKEAQSKDTGPLP